MQQTVNHTIIRKSPRLVIRAGHNTLSFSAIDREHLGTIIHEPYTVRSGISLAANLREALREAQLASGTWQRAMLLVDAPVLIVPVNEFDENQVSDFYRYSISGHDNDVVLSEVLPVVNAVAVYGVNRDLKLVVDDRFDDVRFSHVCASVWNHLYRRSFTGVRQKLYAYFHDKKMSVFSFQQNRFRFANSFDADHAADAVYFILNVWKQLAFDNKRDELHLVGDIPEKDSMEKELRTFIQNVYVINPKAEFNRSPITAISHLPYDLMTYFIK